MMEELNNLESASMSVNDVKLSDYFSAAELSELCEYERERNKNLVLNYFMMRDLGMDQN